MSTVLDRPPEYAPSNGNARGEDPTPPNPFQALRRHPLVALLPVVLLVGAAVALGMTREPVYTAEARVAIGNLNPGEASAPGIVEANQQLASAYSRAITAESVVRPVSRQLKIPRGEVASSLSASPVPKSPLMTISAESSSEDRAIRLTEVATQALVGYVGSLGGQTPAQERALDRYQDARADVAAAQREAGSGDDKAEAAVDAAKLRERAAQRNYLDEAESGGSTPITVLNRAEGAVNDRESKLRLLVVIGALAGIFVGVALATARASRKHRQRLAHA